VDLLDKLGPQGFRKRDPNPIPPAKAVPVVYKALRYRYRESPGTGKLAFSRAYSVADFPVTRVFV
jgi:hypothetical protein